MEVNLKRLENILNKAEVIYLSTSKNDIVSSRPISPLNIGLQLYIKTSAESRKAKEMITNPNIAVCVENFYFLNYLLKMYQNGFIKIIFPLDVRNKDYKDIQCTC